MGLERITERVWVYPYEEERDRPNLSYIRGDRWSLAVDAGHSEDHTKAFYRELEKAVLPLPELTVLTHWHWDHTFGMHAVHRDGEDDVLVHQWADVVFVQIGRNDSHVVRLLGILRSQLEEEVLLALDVLVELVGAAVARHAHATVEVEMQRQHGLLAVDVDLDRHLSLLNFGVIHPCEEIVIDLILKGMAPKGKAADRNQEFVLLFHSA